MESQESYIIGEVVDSISLKYVKGDIPMSQCTVVSRIGLKDKNGNQKENFYSVIAFGKIALMFEAKINTGDKVKLNIEWRSKEGRRGYIYSPVIKSFDHVI